MLSHIKPRYVFRLAFVIVGTLLFLGTRTFIDPDFGWHYRVGEIIARVGFPTGNPFSYTMQTYPYIDYEWLSNFLYYHVYNLFGYNTLALLHVIIALTSASIVISVYGKTKYFLLPWLLVISSMTLRVGVRPQVFNWFLLAILVKIFYDRTNWNKLRLFLPLLMFVWTNLHGSYVLGIGLSALLILFKSFQKRRIISSDFLVLLMSIAATLANPYGIRNWEEVVKQMSQGELFRQSVSEWASALFTFDVGFFAISAFTATFIFVNKNKIRLWEVVVVAGSIFAGVYSGRYAPLSALLMAPFLVKYLNHTEQRAKKFLKGSERLNIFYKILVLVSVLVWALAVFASSRTWRHLNEDGFYPYRAVTFLSLNNDSTNIFADYGLGGYLIWQMPNKKFFVDGRMSGFSWIAPEGESDHAFLEYLDINCGYKDFYETITKYNTDTILVSKITNTTKTTKGVFAEKFDRLAYSLGLTYCPKQISLQSEVEKIGWEVVFEDEMSIIYQK